MENDMFFCVGIYFQYELHPNNRARAISLTVSDSKKV